MGQRDWHCELPRGSTGVNPVGIEIEPRLVVKARSLAAVHGLEVCFVEGSYKPKEVFEPVASGLSVSVADEIGLFECDVIYVYTLPTERDSVTTALARFAVPGAIFMRYASGATCEAFHQVSPG